MSDLPIDETPRVSPLGVGDTFWKYLLYRRHLFAYETVAQRMPDGAICLEVGAGMGYGLTLLSSRAESLMALDLSDIALKSLPDFGNLCSVRGNALELPFHTGTFDCVLALQIIEHVDRDQALRTIREMQRVLKPGGKLFITTPNARWRLLPGQNPRNPYHLHEYTPRDILRLLRSAPLQFEISGVVGRHGAQEIERFRVAPSYLKTYGWLPGRLLAAAFRSFTSTHRKNANRATTTEDLRRDWFELNEDYREGLDFFVEGTR